ncbi:MAG: membrane protein insertion efficiency factor YidD [Bacilli bacterium]
MKNLIIKIIKKYQEIPFKSHDSCKFIPTCSNYMIESLETYGLLKGLYLGIKRLLKCNSFTKKQYIYDPVPKKKT